MKNIPRITALAAMAVLLNLGLQAEQPAGRRGPGGPGGQHRMGPPPELVAQYDADGDGKLDETERAALHADIESGKIARPEGRGPGGPGRRGGPGGPGGQHRMGPPPELVAQYDADGDGKLDETERAALHADVESGKIARPEGRGPGGPGRKGGPGGPGGQRRMGPPPEVVAQYDVDGDGRLDETERAALHADVESGKIARPEGRGPRGPRKSR